MLMIDRNFYVIKQFDGTTWKFSFNKYQGIIYKFFKENTWSEYHVLTKEALNNLSVILLPDDSINVLYQNLKGTIILSKYDEQQWNKQEILTNEKKELFNIYFKTAVIENTIVIIFNIFNKGNNTATLFHQIIDEKNNLSKPKMIDMIKYDYEVPFILYSPDNRELFIMYQRFVNAHELGYKEFNKSNEKWSNFKLIDRSKYSFKDYSAIMFNNILHGLYIKKEDNIDSLNYVHGNNFTFKNNKLFKGTNIESCLIFIIYGQIWCFGIENNKIFSSFSIDNGNNFSTPPYEQSLNSIDIFKSIYITNEPKERKGILGNEIYFTDDDTLQYLIFSILYPYIKKNENSNNPISYIEYYMTEIYLKILSYKKASRKKNQVIIQINNQLEEKKAQIILYKRKFEEINKKLNKFMDLKNQLNKDINLLQEDLTNKKEKITVLENVNMERAEEILSLKDRLSKNINLFQKDLTNEKEKITILENINKKKDEDILSFEDKISQNINLLQKDLTNKQEKITVLENINMEKEIEIDSLKDKLSKYEKIILYLMKKIKNLNKNIRIMYTSISQKHNIY